MLKPASLKSLSLFFVLLIFIDQLSKYSIRAFRGFYICNKGIAFGIILPNWLILPIIIAIISFIGLLILNRFKNPDNKNFTFNPNFKILDYPAVLIFSGALSNLFDRLIYGCVIDFIDLGFWPVFNLADVLICLGVFFLIIKLKKI